MKSLKLLTLMLLVLILTVSCDKKPTENDTVANPVINPSGGTYSQVQIVTITCATTGATICYTLDGSEPTSSSQLYTAPIAIQTSTTIKVKAFKSGWDDSQTVSATYTIEDTGDMAFVQGGTFNNGISDVTLSGFYLSKFELTQTEYQTIMGTNPSNFPDVPSGPVDGVSWFDTIEYCNKRSISESLTPCYSYGTFGTDPLNWPVDWNADSSNHTNISCNWTANGYRLPTEAEWEFAARGGTQTHAYTYSGSNDVEQVTWYFGNSGATTHTVGTKTANELGIYDLSGNALEWVWDIAGSYPSGAQTNPHGAASGSFRENRGGSWLAPQVLCSVFFRHDNTPTSYGSATGLRLCRNNL